MSKKTFISYLLNPKNWWLPLSLIFGVSMVGLIMIGIHTYTEAPPIPTYITSGKKTVFSKEDILKGQAVFQKYALMEYGSMFGDGANRGPDYTAEALHYVTGYMNNYYQLDIGDISNAALLRKGIAEQVKAEIKANHYNSGDNSVILSDAQVFATGELVKLYIQKFTDASSPGAFKPAGYLTNTEEIKNLTAFFFWGAWVCGVERPGETYSYTHNWPYDLYWG